MNWRTMALLACSSVAAADNAGTVTGSLQIGKEKVDLRYGFARKVADPFDKQKDAVRLWLTNAPLTPAMQADEAEVRSAVRSGAIRGIQMDVIGSGDSVNWMVLDNESGFSMSESRSDISLKVAGDVVKGSYAMAEPKKVFGSEYYLKAVLDLPVKPRAVKTQPTPADTAAAGSSPVAAAYLAYYKALTSKNIAALAGMVTPQRAAMMKNPEFPKQLDLIATMAPKNPKPVKVTETGDDATLLLRAMEDGSIQHGTVKMKKITGKWLVESERWSNAE